MEKIIRSLLVNAKPMDNPIVKMLREDVPANATRHYLDCQIVLKGGYAAAGILTVDSATTEDGRHTSFGDVLKLVSIAQTPDKKVMLAEHYFGFDEVQTIVVGRELPEQLVKPVNPTRNGSPIILGH